MLTTKGAQVEALYILLSGHIAMSVDRGAGPHKIMEWRAGDVTGMLPYSRLIAHLAIGCPGALGGSCRSP